VVEGIQAKKKEEVEAEREQWEVKQETEKLHQPLSGVPCRVRDEFHVGGMTVESHTQTHVCFFFFFTTTTPHKC
jgi:hypothetical protein